MARKKKVEEARIELKDDDFKSMIFKIHFVPSDKSIFDIAILSSHRIFKNVLKTMPDEKTHEKALCYLFYVYDPGSPYALHYENIIERKAIVAEYVFGTNKQNEFEKHVLDIMENYDHSFNNLVVYFCLNVVNKSKYIAYISYLERFWKDLEAMRRGENIVLSNLTKIEDILKGYKEQIFALDDNIRLDEQFYAYIKSVDLKLRPEDIAEMFKSYDEPIEELNG